MFPNWTPEGVGLPGLIAIIAVTHVFVAHFAVGGGWYLILTERYARKNNLPGVLDHARRHSRFFVLLTLVFGALSGVGIWFVIGLAAPDSTFLLIRTFVWGWAAEWCFFVIELSAAMLYYKSWSKLDAKRHMTVGWIYAIAATITLLIINGILSFMLTPGSWVETGNFWDGIFNPTYWPTSFMRIAVAFYVAGCFGLVTSCREKDDETRRLLIARSARWIAGGLLAALPFFFWTKRVLPDDAAFLLDQSLKGAEGGVPLLSHFWWTGGISMVFLLVGCIGIAAFKPRRFPQWAAVGAVLLAFYGYGAAEYTREVLRKPFAVRDVIYANGIYVDEVERYRAEGFLHNFEDADWLAGASPKDIGAAMYRRQCSACHTIDGYRGVRSRVEKRLRERGPNSIDVMFAAMYSAKPGTRTVWMAMPPLVGSRSEVAALKTWLLDLASDDLRAAAKPPR